MPALGRDTLGMERCICGMRRLAERVARRICDWVRSWRRWDWRARETEGRKGKQNPERAKTREAKLGCVFTQTLLDDQGRLRRDEHSTTYVGAIETAEQFGPRIYAEAVRRGLKRAGRVIVVGDGAAWIWNIADEHFYDAIQIIDLYHARQHLIELAKSVYGQAATNSKLS